MSGVPPLIEHMRLIQLSREVQAEINRVEFLLSQPVIINKPQLLEYQINLHKRLIFIITRQKELENSGALENTTLIPGANSHLLNTLRTNSLPPTAAATASTQFQYNPHAAVFVPAAAATGTLSSAVNELDPAALAAALPPTASDTRRVTFGPSTNSNNESSPSEVLQALPASGSASSTKRRREEEAAAAASSRTLSAAVNELDPAALPPLAASASAASGRSAISAVTRLSSGAEAELDAYGIPIEPENAAVRVDEIIQEQRRLFGNDILAGRKDEGIDYEVAATLLRQIMFRLYKTSRLDVAKEILAKEAASAAANSNENKTLKYLGNLVSHTSSESPQSVTSSAFSGRKATNLLELNIGKNALSYSNRKTIPRGVKENSFDYEQKLAIYAQGRLSPEVREAIHKKMFDKLASPGQIPLNILLGDDIPKGLSKKIHADYARILRDIFGDKVNERAAYFISNKLLRDSFYGQEKGQAGNWRPLLKTSYIYIEIRVLANGTHGLFLTRYKQLLNKDGTVKHPRFEVLQYHLSIGPSRTFGSTERDGYHFSNHFYVKDDNTLGTTRSYFANHGTQLRQNLPQVEQNRRKIAKPAASGAAGSGGQGQPGYLNPLQAAPMQVQAAPGGSGSTSGRGGHGTRGRGRGRGRGRRGQGGRGYTKRRIIRRA